MNDIQFVINLGTIVSICAGLGSIVAAYKIIKAPVDKLNEKFKAYDVMLGNDKKRLDELQELLEKQQNINLTTTRALIQLLNHEVDGNGIEQAKKIRDELEKELLIISNK